MCNPLSNIDIYSYDAKEVKKAERRWKRNNSIISWYPNGEVGIRAHLKASSFGATAMKTMVLEREEYEKLERSGELNDYTIYLTID